MKPGKRQVASMIDVLETTDGDAEEVASAAFLHAMESITDSQLEELARKRGLQKRLLDGQRFITLAILRGPDWGTREKIGEADAPDMWAFPPTKTYSEAQTLAHRVWRSPQGYSGRVWVVPLAQTPTEAWGGLQALQEASWRGVNETGRVEKCGDLYQVRLEGLPGLIVEEKTESEAKEVMTAELRRVYGPTVKINVTWKEHDGISRRQVA